MVLGIITKGSLVHRKSGLILLSDCEASLTMPVQMTDLHNTSSQLDNCHMVLQLISMRAQLVIQSACIQSLLKPVIACVVIWSHTIDKCH